MDELQIRFREIVVAAVGLVATALVVAIFEVDLAIPLALMLVILSIGLLNVVVQLHQSSFALNHLFLCSLPFFNPLLPTCSHFPLFLWRAAF
jgi:hypothetical protein